MICAQSPIGFLEGRPNNSVLSLRLFAHDTDWQYSSAGVEPGQFSYVEVLDVTAMRVEPVGKESSWNVDGELLENNHVTCQVHKGLVEIFARGVEL